jgi:hypothetical protein
MSVSKNLKWTICLGGLLAPWLLASASVPAVAQLHLEQVVSLPVLPISGAPQATLRAFDISWVDPARSPSRLSWSVKERQGESGEGNPPILLLRQRPALDSILTRARPFYYFADRPHAH